MATAGLVKVDQVTGQITCRGKTYVRGTEEFQDGSSKSITFRRGVLKVVRRIANGIKCPQCGGAVVREAGRLKCLSTGCAYREIISTNGNGHKETPGESVRLKHPSGYCNYTTMAGRFG